MTLEELDRIRSASTASKNKAREFINRGEEVPPEVQKMVEEAEAEADKAVLQWIKQGCKE